MDIKNLQKGCALAMAAYLVIAMAFYWIAGDQLRFRDDKTDAVTPAIAVGELVQGMEIRQQFTTKADEITSISMRLSTYSRTNTSRVAVCIADGDGTIVMQTELDASQIEDNAIQTVPFPEPLSVTPGMVYALVLTSPDGVPGNAITAWQGNTMSASRAEVDLFIPEGEKLLINGAPQEGKLHFSLQTRRYLWLGQAYWHLAVGTGLLLAGYLAYVIRAAKRGKSILALRVISAFQQYGYLMRQLVSRDFKTKYKRSVLGVLWSFLNPLLTMIVQYIVFSTLFKSDIPNFAVYLLTGSICFNLFSEATSMALTSIVNNASLITKVYVPKYIYPLTRVMSSMINFGLSLIPLLLVMLITHTALRPAALLLPFGILCLFCLSLGVGFLLASAMVFFRDTQFLWGILIMLWMYLTPVFYPETIIPARFMVVYKMNPMYHIIRFFRTVLMSGVSPEPKAYLLCMIASVVPLIIGMVVFRKTQDQFVLNL